MKRVERRHIVFCIALAAAILLVAGGVGMLARTFTQYNDLSLQRQDSQLRDMARAADESVDLQLKNLQTDLVYVLGRRGFIQAEQQWAETGSTEDLLFRMQENLISQNSLIHTMLAIREGEILLSANGSTNYFFPSRREGALQPCFAGDGTMYLALLESTAHAEYAALIDLAGWYADLARMSGGDKIRLLLLDGSENLLMHQWQGEMQVTAVESLNEENCDIAAVRHMMESRNSGQSLTSTYHLSYPGDDFIHEMRMTVIPLEETYNGYFIVGLTSDYDEIVRPMNAAAVQLIGLGGMAGVGVLLIVFLLLGMVQKGYYQDQTLRRLTAQNAQTQELLEKTQELAHHQRLETIGTLASSIAHEFNNLLTPIMGYAILTLEGLPEECDELAENVTEIYEASRKAKTIISRMSDLSRKNAELTFRPVSLPMLVEKALQVAAPAQPANVVTLVRRGEEECRVEGNEMQISQLLLNLILNAYHAMEQQGGKLTLSVSQEAGETVLRVSDTGVGIPKASLPRIFEPFYTTKESGRGTGLGLAIVHQVVESHHGRISVQSEVGAGTEFTLHFPAYGENPDES